MRLLVLSLSEHSLGELHNALLFARQLPHPEDDVLFVATEGHSAYVRQAGMLCQVWTKNPAQNGQLLDELLVTCRPEVVLLADYYNLFMEGPLLEPARVEKIALPLATFDSMNFAPGPTRLEKEILRHCRHSRVFGRGGQFQTVLPAVPAHMAVLRSCPINRPVAEKGILPVSLYKESCWQQDEDKRRSIRQRFNFSEREKLVMLARSSWAQLVFRIIAMEHGRGNSFSYERVLQQLLRLYLGQVEGTVVVLGIGLQPGFSAVDEKVRFVSLPFLSLEEYQSLLWAVDLFITDNITSCSAAKAAVGGVPVLVLTSSLESRGDGMYLAPFELSAEALRLLQQWERAVPGSIFPYNVYPFGWIKELAPLLQDNPYCDLLVRAEMFDVQGTGELIQRLLYDQAVQERLAEARQQYRQILLTLPGAREAMEWVHNY
ncbi:MAG: DUF6365 family protein [Desulfurispora sp.]|uniref:DUF6365 family protein n=1 Tax=Desulfurispora sp. TaxID=3014275 RepID=UPI00404AF9DF